jgi:hypothetical protein
MYIPWSKCEPAPLDYVIHAYLVTFFCFLLAKAAGPCFPLAGEICLVYADYLNVDQSSNPTLLNISKAPAASQLTFIMRKLLYIPHVIGYGCKKVG